MHRTAKCSFAFMFRSDSRSEGNNVGKKMKNNLTAKSETQIVFFLVMCGVVDIFFFCSIVYFFRSLETIRISCGDYMSYILRCNDNKFVISLSFIVVGSFFYQFTSCKKEYGALGQMQNSQPIQMLSQQNSGSASEQNKK